MFYQRNTSSCLSSLLVFLTFAVIIIAIAIYVGFYILIGLLILGAIIGGLVSVFSLLKALPQSKNDMNGQYFHGNKAAVALKKMGYFFICIAKYSFYNDLQYAKNAFQNFTAKKVLSFSKWINLAFAVTVLTLGLLMLVAILILAILSFVVLFILLMSLVVATIVIMLGVGILVNLFAVAKEAIRCGKKSFSPICYKFAGRCYFSDLLAVPKNFFSQMGKWIITIWNTSIQLFGNYNSWFNATRRIWYPLAIALIISCPVAAIIVILVTSVVLVVLSMPIYLVDAVWILIKAIFKF